MTFIDWFHKQLEEHNITKAELSRKSGVTLSILKPGYLRRHPLMFPTVIILCETLIMHSNQNKQDFINLIHEALQTIPEYNYSIKRLEKQQ